jgi:hypothetical protein
MTRFERDALPCPFCGGRAKQVPGECILVCTGCYAKVIDSRWNLRDTFPQPPSDQGLQKQIRSGIWSMAEWAFSEGQRGSNWGDYTGAAASERMEKIIYAIFASKKGGEE